VDKWTERFTQMVMGSTLSSRGVAVKVEHDKLVRKFTQLCWGSSPIVIAAPAQVTAYNASVRVTLMAGKSSTIKGDTWALKRLRLLPNPNCNLSLGAEMSDLGQAFDDF